MRRTLLDQYGGPRAGALRGGSVDSPIALRNRPTRGACDLGTLDRRAGRSPGSPAAARPRSGNGTRSARLRAMRTRPSRPCVTRSCASAGSAASTWVEAASSSRPRRPPCAFDVCRTQVPSGRRPASVSQAARRRTQVDSAMRRETSAPTAARELRAERIR